MVTSDHDYIVTKTRNPENRCFAFCYRMQEIYFDHSSIAVEIHMDDQSFVISTILSLISIFVLIYKFEYFLILIFNKYMSIIKILLL